MRIVFAGYKGWHTSVTTKVLLFTLAALFLILGTVGIASTSAFGKVHHTDSSTIQQTLITNGAARWNNDAHVTPLAALPVLADQNQLAVSPLFTSYYQQHGIADSLGKPLTVAFPTDQGWLQFFEAGVLFFPTPRQTYVLPNANDVLAGVINADTKQVAVGVVRLPLLQALLTTGSVAPIGGEGSTLTYVDLRAATQMKYMIPVQASHTAINTYLRTTLAQSIFVKGGVREGKDVGHVIAAPFWSYINRLDPDEWQEDIGIPLTEALPFTITQNGSVHHMLIQVFSYAGLLFDQDSSASSNQPGVYRLDTGLDYLRTFGFPSVEVKTGQTIWSQGESALLAAPDTGSALMHVGQNFPLVLSGNTTWAGGMLWYNVRWNTFKGTYSGWVNAGTVTFTTPVNGESQASFDVLSPDLQTYLGDSGPNVGVVLYDVTHQMYYTYNSSTQFIVASSMKIPIMLTFLNMVEQQGRDPDDNEMGLLTTMIENSNNDSASSLFSAVGEASGIASYMQKIGVTGLNPDDDAWGYSLITPQAMIDMLTLLYQGKILNEAHRTLALNLMENIESDQQVGIGDTAPNGATVAMKDGWVTGPDNLWAMNSSGIVTSGNETYILSVYTQEQSSLDDGQAIARHICGAIASLFTS